MPLTGPDILGARRRELWLDARPLGPRVHEFLAQLNGTSLSAVQVSPSQLPLAGRPPATRIVVDANGAGDANGLADIVVFDDVARLEASPLAATARALSAVIESERDLRGFAEQLARGGAAYGIVDLKDETNIPLELLIAWFQGSPIKILKRVRNVVDGDIAVRTLQHGADGFVLVADDPSTVTRACLLVDPHYTPPLELVEWEVRQVEHLGSGHRACVDFAALLTPTEGMLVGSTCAAFIVMCSETHPLPYMPLRPFRVNAGAVHSYVVGPGGQTNYLSELEAGAQSLVVDTSGRARPVTVGRVKIERRPLLLLKFGAADGSGSVIVQDDWHVRITGAQGEVLNVTHCKSGTKLLGWRGTAGRHCGNAVNEELQEQ